MPKVDKTNFTKEQWKRYKRQRDREKDIEKQLKHQKHLENLASLAQEVIGPSLLPEVEETVLDFTPPSNKEKIAFVCGNGTSREPIELEALKSYGKIYACNAVYRQFSPDYLVAVDTKMILEINKAGYQHRGEVWTNPNKAYSRMQNLNYFQPSRGWSSGPTALWLASQHKNDVVYILGFDYKGLEEGKVLNNLFADTPNYKRSTDPATFFGNWSRQTAQVIKENSKKRYIRVIASGGYIPKDLANFKNLSHITVEDFKKIFNLQ